MLGYRWLSVKTSWLPVPYERRGAQRAQPARVPLVKFLVLLHRRGWGARSHLGTLRDTALDQPERDSVLPRSTTRRRLFLLAFFPLGMLAGWLAGKGGKKRDVVWARGG